MSKNEREQLDQHTMAKLYVWLPPEDKRALQKLVDESNGQFTGVSHLVRWLIRTHLQKQQ